MCKYVKYIISLLFKLIMHSTIFSIGAALTVDAQSGYKTLERLPYNPLCFLLYEDERVPPDQWENVCLVLMMMILNVFHIQKL